MRFAGQVFRVGKSWAIEIPILDIVTQGRTKKEAYEMIADAVESLVNKKGFEVRVFGAKGAVFEIGASDQGALTALLLRRMRQRAMSSSSRAWARDPRTAMPGTSKAGRSRASRSSRSSSRRWRPIRSS